MARAAIVLALLVLVAPAAAKAAEPAAVTISSCKRDSVTVAGKVKLAGSTARNVRGATLQLRFQALALFGLPHSGDWRTAGKRASGSGQEAFPGLAADSWIGLMSWRFKKGRRTVASGLARSQPLRVGGSKGRATCTIAEGLKPRDTTPPSLYVLPADDAWHHAPASVQLTASDDFSGVQSVRYSLDGGPKTAITNGSTFAIAAQGQHTVDWEATDVAGNTGTRSAVVKVDSGPPTKPVLSRPVSVTQSTTPIFQWSASTDSGSGMRGYLLTIRKASDNSIVAFQAVGPATTSLASPANLTDGETYTAVVTAVDNTADLAWTSDSDPLTFRVDSHADATGFTPANGTVLSGGSKNGPFTISLDRAANASTVSSTTVKLDRSDGTDPSYSAACAGTPCSSITVTPSAPLGEGHYVLSLDGVKSADEGLTFTGSANYAVPFVEDPNGVDVGGGVCISDATGTDAGTVTAAGSQPGVVSFDWSFSGGSGWQVRVLNGTTELAQLSGGPGSGHATVPFTIPAGSNVLTVEFRSKCPSGSNGSLNTDNVIGTRVP
jgi:hypothetical protein